MPLESPWKSVPGVTAAIAAAAEIEVSLTERGVTDTLVFASGASRDGDALPVWSRHALPRTTLVSYMGGQEWARDLCKPFGHRIARRYPG